MYFERYVYDYGELARSGTRAAGLLCAFAAVAAAQIGLGLSPMRVEVKVAAGTTRAGSLAISNGSPGEARYRTEILDFNLDREATPQFELDLPVESQYSCHQWFTFNPMEAAIPAGGNMIVRYTLRVPANAPPRTYHCGVGFTSLPPARRPQESAVGMISVVRVVNTFYVTVGNPQPSGELKAIVLEKVADKETSGLRAIFRVDNTGYTNLRGEGKVEVLDSTGKVVESEEFPTGVILPKRTQLLPLVLKRKLSDGNYTIRARVNLGLGEILEATLGFRPPPPPAPAVP